MRRYSILLCAALALTSALPAYGRERETIVDAVAQPLHDLSIIKTRIPPILKKASEAPYAPAGDCEIMRQEIRDLDKVLGDDLGELNDDGGTLITSAVKSAVKLPFNGVIRRITGAHRRDAAYDDALVAGVARRAFLKGALTACSVVPPLVPEIAASATSAPVQQATAPRSPTAAAATGEATVVVATAP